MRVMVIGSGAREHSLAARLASTDGVRSVFVLGENPGIAQIARCIPARNDVVSEAVSAAIEHRIDLVVVGPEAPLVEGVSDALQQRGIHCYGPSRAAAQLEGSKAFSKAFMARHGIPTAPGAVFTSSAEAAAYIRARPHAPVVKASGLAAGKGVFVCDTHDEACARAHELIDEAILGESGRTVVIEDRLDGEEVSLHVVSDGERYAVLGAAQDHKRLLDGDRGPNTGGMGAYAPVAAFTEALEREVCATVVEPTLRGMRDEGAPFRGTLFVGLMLVQGRPLVLEYNVRFGDPECAVLLARWRGNLASVLMGAAQGRLPEMEPHANRGAALGVVMASAGYPSRTLPPAVIHGLDVAPAEGVRIFHAGTRAGEDGSVLATGGRVLLVTAEADDFVAAAERAYRAVENIRFEGAQFRRDIGWRARG